MVWGDSSLFEICGFVVHDMCRVKRRGAINQFKPEGGPRQFLLQLLGNLTSNFDRFFIIIFKRFKYCGNN